MRRTPNIISCESAVSFSPASECAERVITGGGTQCPSSPRSLSQLPNVHGFFVHYLAIAFIPKSPSKFDELLRSTRLDFGAGLSAQVGRSPQVHYRGPAFIGDGIHVYTEPHWRPGRSYSYPISLVIHGSGCERLGNAAALLAICDRFTAEWQLNVPTVSRIDLALDFSGWAWGWTSLPFFYTQLSPRQTIPPQESVPLQSVKWGTLKGCQVGLYDKHAELAHRGCHVTDLYPHLHATVDLSRLEVRFGRAWLRNHNLHCPGDVLAARSTLMRRVMESAIIHRGRNGKRSRQWIYLTMRLGEDAAVPRELPQEPFDYRHAALSIAGYLARYALERGLTQADDALHAILVDLEPAGVTWAKLLAKKVRERGRA